MAVGGIWCLGVDLGQVLIQYTFPSSNFVLAKMIVHREI